MNEYIITQYNEELKKYCLKYVCGTSKKHAEAVLFECQIEEPKEKFQIEEAEPAAQWWNQGGLD